MFSNGDLVEIHSTNDSRLDGQICEIIGKEFDFGRDANAFYIIQLEQPITLDDGFVNSAMPITNSCLKLHTN